MPKVESNNFSSVHYSAAPQSEGHESDDHHRASFLPDSIEKTRPSPADILVPDKSNRTLCQKLAFYSCLLGFVFILGSVVSAFLMKPYVEQKILENFPLVEDSEVFRGWKDPPVTPVVSFYFFNLTNKEAFLKGDEKPNLREVGPYVYRQKMEKVNISFPQEEPTVTYMVAKQYFFSPEMSCPTCEEDDYLILPNIPLFGAFQKMSKESSTAKSFFKDYLESFDFAIDSKPFVRVTVNQYLWGYPSLLLSLNRVQTSACGLSNSKRKETEDGGWDDFGGFDDWDSSWEVGSKSRSQNLVEPDPCEVTPNNLSPFGLFVGRNGTGMDIRTVNTGTENLEDRGNMAAWHNKKTLDYWSSEECNTLKGHDPSSLPLHIQKTDDLEIFIGQLCRTLKFKYVREVIVNNEFHAYRFTPLENTFHSPEDNPDNRCYCLEEPCLPSGVLDIRGCQENSPIFMSWPHFLYGDASLTKGVTGLHHDQSKHSFILDIVPKYGITLKAQARLQMNIIIEKNSGFGYFDKISQTRIFYPFMWLEDGIQGPSQTIANNVRFLLNLPQSVQSLVALIGLGVGVLLLIPEVIFWTRSCCLDPKKEEKLENL